MVFCIALAAILDLNVVLQLSTISLLISHCLWVHPQFSWSRIIFEILSTSDEYFSFQPIKCYSTQTNKNTVFSRCTNEHSQMENLLQPHLKRIFSNCLSHKCSAQKWMTIQIPLKRNFWVFHTGPWFSAIRVVVNESKCLDIPILEFSTICEHLPFLLVHRNPAIWRWYPWLLLPSFVMLMILVL